MNRMIILVPIIEQTLKTKAPGKKILKKLIYPIEEIETPEEYSRYTS